MVSYLTGNISFCLLTNFVMRGFEILITVQQSTAEFNSITAFFVPTVPWAREDRLNC